MQTISHLLEQLVASLLALLINFVATYLAIRKTISALQGMLHQAISSMQLAIIITKNSIKTVSANFRRQIDSQNSKATRKPFSV
jgi:hypothetical protein